MKIPGMKIDLYKEITFDKILSLKLRNIPLWVIMNYCYFETAETMIGKAVRDWKRDWFPQQSLF